jgi:hypothetical protein
MVVTVTVVTQLRAAVLVTLLTSLLNAAQLLLLPVASRFVGGH